VHPATVDNNHINLNVPADDNHTNPRHPGDDVKWTSLAKIVR
jgi:hypothetical protein